MPGLSATTAGSAFGFALQVYINSVRKLPLTRITFDHFPTALSSLLMMSKAIDEDFPLLAISPHPSHGLEAQGLPSPVDAKFLNEVKAANRRGDNNSPFFRVLKKILQHAKKRDRLS
eukprot:jgi/Pico_ML_1/50792/g1938.t2